MFFQRKSVLQSQGKTFEAKNDAGNNNGFVWLIKRMQDLYDISKNVCISEAIQGPGTKGSQQ